MRTTTITVPGNARRYIDALDQAAQALKDTEPAAATLLHDVAQSIDQALREQKALRRLRALHSKNGHHCYTCIYELWPCRSAKALADAPTTRYERGTS